MTAARLVSRLLRAALLLVLLLAVGISALLLWVVESERGTAWSLRQLDHRLPELVIEGASGAWRRGVTVAELRYDTEALQLEVQDLELALRLQPWARRIAVERLIAGHIEVVQAPAPPSEPQPLELPSVTLPLTVELAALRVAAIHYRRAETAITIAPLTAALELAGNQLSWRDLALGWEGRQLATSGWIELRDNYPLQADAHLADPNLEASAGVAVSGDLAGLRLHVETAGPVAALIEAELDAVDPALPFWLEARLAQRLPLGADDPAQMALETADIQLEGNLEAAAGTVKATLAVPGYEHIALTLPLQWQAPALTVQPQLVLGADQAQGQAALDCSFSAEPPWPLRCDGNLTAVSLAPWLGEGTLSSPLQFTVDSWQPLALAVALPGLTGELAGETIEGEASVAGDGQRWRIDALRLAIGANHLDVGGELGDRSALDITLQAPRLAQLHPELAGSATLSATVSGMLSKPDLAFSGSAHSLRWQQASLRELTVEGAVAALGEQASEVTLAARDLAQGDQQVGAFDLAIGGTRLQHDITLNAAPIAGQAALHLGCNGASDAMLTQWQLTCADGQVRWEKSADDAWTWQFAQPLRLAWQQADGAVTVQPFCLASDDGELCLSNALRWRDGNLSGELTAHAIALDRFIQLPEAQLRLASRPLADARITLASLAPLRLTASAEVAATAWRWVTPDGIERGELGPIALDIDASDQRALLRLATSGPTLGTLQAELAVSDPRGARGLAGQITLDEMALAPLGWIAPELQLEGELQALMTLGGTLAAPTVSGRVALRDGHLLPPAIGQPLEEIALNIDFDLDRATIDGSFLLAPGLGRISGSVDLPAPDRPWQLALAIEGDNLQIQPLAGSLVRFAPRMTLAATPERIDVRGRIAVEQADLRLKALPPDTADVSADVEWVGAEEATQAPLQLHADIALDLGPATHFEGFGAELRLAGALRLRHTPERGLRLQGEVQVPEGRYRAYGQRLLVRRGTALFTGPPGNPELNLEAIREMPPTMRDQVAGIRVLGPLQNPSAQLFAEPSLPESDIAYFLLTGRMPPEDGSGGDISATGALLSLGLAGTGDQTARLAERFGISDFQISAQETEGGTEATVSGYLTPRLYVRYGTGLHERGNSITFQYRLTPKLVLEAISGVEEALDLLYSFTID